MTEANVMSTLAKHLQSVTLPAAASAVGISDLDMKVTSAQRGGARYVRLTRLNTGADKEALEGAVLVQLSLRIARLSEMDEWTSMRLEEEIRKELGFEHSKTMQSWIVLKNFNVTPAVATTGKIRLEPASSQLWVTRNEGGDPVCIHSAMRLNAFFDELRA